jgi:hypothetical protein
MDTNGPVTTILSDVTFRDAVWLYPPAFTLHVLEERPRFTGWAKRYASPLFTQRDYDTIHVAGIVGAIVSATILWAFPTRMVVFTFFAFMFTPGLLFNTIFHAGATFVTGEYCPGIVTAVTVYVPVFYFLSRLAWRENLLDSRMVIFALIIAAVFHTWEVGHNVFKAW